MQWASNPTRIAEVTNIVCQENEGDIDFVEAVEAHLEWRGKLITYIEGKEIDASTSRAISHDDSCSLGSWLQGGGQSKFGHLPSFRRLALEHAQFHSVAGMIISRVRDDDFQDAELLLKNEFSQVTRRVLVAIGELNELVKQKAE